MKRPTTDNLLNEHAVHYVFPNGMPRPHEVEQLAPSAPVISLESLTPDALSRLVIDIALNGSRGLTGAYHATEDMFQRLESGESVIIIDDQLSPVIVPAELAMAVANASELDGRRARAVVA